MQGDPATGRFDLHETKPASSPRCAVKAIFIRHSESTGNEENVVKGIKEYPLNEKGKADSVAMAARIARFKPTVVVSSPLSRAKVPAEALAKKAGVSLKIDKGLLPQNFGTLEGKQQRTAEPQISKLAMNSPDEKVGGGESFNTALGKNDAALRRVKMMISNGERPAVVTHSRVLRNLDHSLFGGKAKDPTKGGPEPSGFVTWTSGKKLQTHAPVVIDRATRRS